MWSLSHLLTPLHTGSVTLGKPLYLSDPIFLSVKWAHQLVLKDSMK